MPLKHYGYCVDRNIHIEMPSQFTVCDSLTNFNLICTSLLKISKGTLAGLRLANQPMPGSPPEDLLARSVPSCLEFKLSKEDPKTRFQIQLVYLESNPRNHWYKIGK